MHDPPGGWGDTETVVDAQTHQGDNRIVRNQDRNVPAELPLYFLINKKTADFFPARTA
jgi:hypothetical protein